MSKTAIKSGIATKSLVLLAFLMFASSQAHAGEMMSSKLSFKNIFNSCGNSVSGNTYCWSKAGQQTVAPEQKSESKKITQAFSFGQRLIAASLGVILEVTTGHSYDDREIE